MKMNIILVLAFIASCASHKENNLKVIDAHIHTQFTGERESNSSVMQSKEELLKQMKENNVVGGIAHTYWDGKHYNDVREHGIIHCAGVDKIPKIFEIEKGLQSGKFSCIKIFLGYVHQYASDKNYRPLYKLAEKYDVPVVFHTGDTYYHTGKVKYSDPMTIDEVAVDFPNTRFVIAHCGIPWYQTAAELAFKNPNVYLDGSGIIVGDLSKTSPEVFEKVLVEPIRWVFTYIENPKKLMYGSDWPLADMKPYLEAFKRAIPKEHWQAVFHDNAARVFKLKTSKNE